MKTTIVQYKVKADRAEENKNYIRSIFEELNENEPDDLRYVSFCLADGVSFVHIAVVETADDSNPLQQSPAFKEFLEKIKDRCEQPPAASPAEIVGSYRLFWEKITDPA